MILRPSASDIVCGRLYDLPSKLLEKDPSALLTRVYTPHACMYIPNTKYIHKYFPRARFEPVKGCAVPSCQRAIYPLVIRSGSVQPRGN